MLLISIVASISAGDFLGNWATALEDKESINMPYEIAADVLVPDMKTGFNKKIDYPQLPETFGGQKAKYRAVGEFGQFENDEQAQQSAEYGMLSPNQRGKIRGYMDFIPGGIPASEGFDYDKSLQTFPQIMQGIPEGNMPVFRHY